MRSNQTRKKIRMLAFLHLAITWGFAFGQANISGTATLSLVDGGTDCNGAVSLVEVHADVTGLSGDGGMAGINAFVLKFNLNNGNLFSIARPANSPIPFDMVYTQKSLVGSQDSVTVIGWAADSQAPNGSYHLLTLQFAGAAGSVGISIDGVESNLASKFIGGFGPDAISLQTPPAAIFMVPDPISFHPLQALPFWLDESSFYDLVPSGRIDMLDFVKLVTCTE